MKTITLDRDQLETSCPACGARFVRVEDPSTSIEDGRGGTRPAMLYPKQAICERGHRFEVASFSVTKTGAKIDLGPRCNG